MAALSTTPAISPLADGLAPVLREEFGVPFAFVDAVTGGKVPTMETSFELHAGGADAMLVHARSGEPCVRSLPDGDYQLELPIFHDQNVVMIAYARMVPLVTGNDPYNTGREKHALQRWLRAVCGRIRAGADESFWAGSPPAPGESAGSAWNGLLSAARVLRRLRIYQEPPRNVQLVLEAALPLLSAEAIIWLPKQLNLPGMVHGETSLTLADCNDLLNSLAAEAGFKPPQPYLCNNPGVTTWGAWFPAVRSVLILQAVEQEPLGWLVVLNHADGAGFRKTHAAMLAPFLSALVFYGKTLKRFQDIKELLVGLTRSLTIAMDAKDPMTMGHSERVARIAVEIGRRLGMTANELGDVYLAGLLHDIGKIGIKDHVLFKPGKLSADEFEHVKEHVSIGYAILSDLRSVHNLLPGILYHHENFDGTGYPDRLRGEEIPLLARILAVADAYDSMSSGQPYRAALAIKEIEANLKAGAGTQWDPKIVAALFEAKQVIHAIQQCGAGESLRVAMNNALQSRRVTANMEQLTPVPSTSANAHAPPAVFPIS